MRKSHFIPGLCVLAMLGLPLASAPWASRYSLEFIRKVEGRKPAEFPEFSSARALIAGETWAGVDAAVNDRVPFRRALVRAKRDIEVVVLGDRMSGEIGIGRDGWLFYLPAFAEVMGDEKQVREAFELLEKYVTETPPRARLIMVPAPDKHTIYPEQLTSHFDGLMRRSRAARERLHAWFASEGVPERVNPWPLFMEAKEGAAEPVYEPTGSHHSSYGSMILARAMIAAVDPGLWDDADVRYIQTQHFRSDLSRLAGYLGDVSAWNFFEVVRPGIKLERFYYAGKEMPGVDRPPPAPAANRQPARYVSRSAGARLITGRTLIVHDSFVAEYLRPTLRQFFEDITFVHWQSVTPSDLQEALDDFDLVYVQSAERAMRPRIAHFFSRKPRLGTHRLLTIADPPEEGP